MMMEVLEKYEEKFKYDIYGYLGEDYKVVLVDKDKVFMNNKECFIVIKIMYVYFQFCFSGDMILMVIQYVFDEFVKEEVDEYFLIILSDVNFD